MTKQWKNVILTLGVLVGSIALARVVEPRTTLGTVVAGLALFFPGYCLSRALFPRRLDTPEQLMLTGGLSLASLAVGGLVLGLLPGGLNGASWAMYILVLIGVSAAVAAWRRSRNPEHSGTRGSINSTVAIRQGAMLVGAAFIAAAGLLVARSPVPESAAQGYTLLWAVPNSADNPSAVSVGVRSFEPSLLGYHLKVVSGDQVLQDIALSLQPVDEWRAEVALPADSPAVYDFLLYRDDTPSAVYRRATIRVGT
jgi:Protein of unknown function (DUF1616)